MSGCITHFPEHRFAEIQRKLNDKAAEYSEKGWKLASWDEAKLDAIDDYAEGKITESQADAKIRDAEWRRMEYNRKRGRRW